MPPTMPVVRSASLSGYQELAALYGLNAPAMIRRAGLISRSFADPETPVSAEAVGRLLEASAEASGAEDFGLQLASRRNLSNLGPVSLVLREEPTARQALQTLCRYLCLLNASLTTWVEDHPETVVIREQLLLAPGESTRQAVELALGVMFRILRELMGSGWRPLRICFMHRPPNNLAGHRAFFGQGVDFNEAFNGFVCRRRDLCAPLPPADPSLARFARQYLDEALSTRREGTAETLRRLIVALLPGGRCTAQQVAQHLGVDRRTVHRHLAAEGLTFSRLLDTVRSELVIRQITQSDLPLREVASLMGFSGPSAFSHWFQSVFGCSVTEWRQRH